MITVADSKSFIEKIVLFECFAENIQHSLSKKQWNMESKKLRPDVDVKNNCGCCKLCFIYNAASITTLCQK